MEDDEPMVELDIDLKVPAPVYSTVYVVRTGWGDVTMFWQHCMN